MLEILGIVGVFAICGLMIWTATRIEPHWASRDGRRFACASRRLAVDGTPYGRWKQVRVGIDDDGILEIQGGTVLARARRSPADWIIVQREPAPPKGKAIYVVKGGNEGRMLLRVPAKSRCVPVLDELLGLPPAAGSSAATAEVTDDT